MEPKGPNVIRPGRRRIMQCDLTYKKNAPWTEVLTNRIDAYADSLWMTAALRSERMTFVFEQFEVRLEDCIDLADRRRAHQAQIARVGRTVDGFRLT